jgi:hypothetical protein
VDVAPPAAAAVPAVLGISYADAVRASPEEMFAL